MFQSFFVFIFVLCGYVFRSTTALPSGEVGLTEYSNIVTIPDIHGDVMALLYSLWISFRDVESDRSMTFDTFAQAFQGSPGSQLSPNPTETLLIQLGDIFDRGPNGLACLHVVEKIEEVIGWKVLRVYGNHELLNHVGLHGDYLHPAETAKFAAYFGSPQARRAEFLQGGSVWKSITDSTLLMVRIGGHHADLSLDSPSTLFVHGGVETHWMGEVADRHLGAHTSIIDALNRLTQQIFEGSYDGPNDVFGRLDGYNVRQSPLWIRDLTELNSDYVCSETLPRILKFFGVARIVVGHTPQERMRSLCGSKIILADASMSRWMRQHRWTLTDESDPPQVDGAGQPILANPCALIMNQFEGEVGALKSVYFDVAAGTHSSDMFYPLELTFRSPFRIVPPSNRPVNFQSTASLGGDLVFISYQSGGIGQRLGEMSLRIVDVIRRGNLGTVFGIPNVLFPPGPDGLVIYDTNGSSLSQISLPIVRQIVEILRDVDSLGLGFDLKPRSNILNLFVIESGTGLVKLVDLSVLIFSGRAQSLEAQLGHICTELDKVGSLVDFINYKRIVEETISDFSETRFVAEFSHVSVQAPDVKRDLSDSALWVSSPLAAAKVSSTNLAAQAAMSEELELDAWRLNRGSLMGALESDEGDDMGAFGLDIEAGRIKVGDLPTDIIQPRGVFELGAFGDALTKDPYGSSVPHLPRKIQLAEISRGVIYLVESGGVLLELNELGASSAKLAEGIIPFESQPSDEGHMQIGFAVIGKLLLTEYTNGAIPEDIHDDVALSILEQVSKLHTSNILVGISQAGDHQQILNFFIIDESHQVHLVDISMLERDSSGEKCAAEMEMLVSHLQKLFSLHIEDTHTHIRSGSPDSSSARTTRENSIASTNNTDDDEYLLL